MANKVHTQVVALLEAMRATLHPGSTPPHSAPHPHGMAGHIARFQAAALLLKAFHPFRSPRP